MHCLSLTRASVCAGVCFILVFGTCREKIIGGEPLHVGSESPGTDDIREGTSWNLAGTGSWKFTPADGLLRSVHFDQQQVYVCSPDEFIYDAVGSPDLGRLVLQIHYSAAQSRYKCLRVISRSPNTRGIAVSAPTLPGRQDLSAPWVASINFVENSDGLAMLTRAYPIAKAGSTVIDYRIEAWNLNQSILKFKGYRLR